jgi:hypothetical protein
MTEEALAASSASKGAIRIASTCGTPPLLAIVSLRASVALLGAVDHGANAQIEREGWCPSEAAMKP